MVNQQYYNKDGFVDSYGDLYTRMNESNDREIDGTKYYAYESPYGYIYYLTVDLSTYNKNDIIDCEFYYDSDEGECDNSWSDVITVTKYNSSYSELLEQTLDYSEGDNQLLEVSGKVENVIAYSNGNTLTAIEIPDSVTNIGYWAFSNCEFLTGITLGNSVTTIGNYAFNRCTSLTGITIPDSVTNIGNSAFYSCTTLTFVSLPSGLTSIGSNVFALCKSLTGITIPDSVTSIGYCAFYNCFKLTSVSLPSKLKSIYGQAFYNCTSLTGITIPDSVTTIGNNAFQNCFSITGITYNGTTTQWNSITKGNNWHYNVPSTTVVTCTNGTVALS